MAQIQQRAKGAAILGALITATLFVVNWLIGLIGFDVAPLFSIQPVSPISGTVGQKILGLLSGTLSIDFANMWALALPIFLSSWAIVLVGAFLIDMFKLPSGKKDWQRIALTILYGTAVFYVLIVGLVMKAWQVFLGLAIYTAIVAYATAFLADQFKVKI